MLQIMRDQALLTTQRSRQAAIELLRARVRSTARDVTSGLPHWADRDTGRWTTTPDGDWTGGAWLGMLWIDAFATGDASLLDRARSDLVLLQARLPVRSAFRGFPFYYGAVLGTLLHDDQQCRVTALACALSLLEMFSSDLGLIPLGSGAEEGGDVGERISSVDSLQASPLLYWAFRQTADPRYRRCPRPHEQGAAIHQRPDGSIIQSSRLSADGRVGSTSHKGYSDRSVWARAQAWGMLYAAMAAEMDDEPSRWLAWAALSADWWIAHLPASTIAPWDFDAPDNDARVPDTAATAIASVALLKLAASTADTALAERARTTATASVDAMTNRHLTPLATGDDRPAGMLLDACFNMRADSRPQDAATSCESSSAAAPLQALLILEADRARSFQPDDDSILTRSR